MQTIARLEPWQPLVVATATWRQQMDGAAAQSVEAAKGLAAESGPAPADRLLAAVAGQDRALGALQTASETLSRIADILAALQSGQEALGAQRLAEKASQTAARAAQLAEERLGLLDDTPERDPLEKDVADAKEAAARSAERAKEAAAKAQEAATAAREQKRAVSEEARKEAQEKAKQAIEEAKKAREIAKKLDKKAKDELEPKEKKPPLHFQASTGGGSGTGSGTEGQGFAIAGSAPGSPLTEPPPPPEPRDASDAMDQSVTAESAPNAKQSSEAELQFSQSLNMMAGMEAAEMSENTMLMPGADELAASDMDSGESGESSESESSSEEGGEEGGESSESGEGGGSKSGGGRKKSGKSSGAARTGRIDPSVFGVTDDAWLKLPSQLRQDLNQAAEGRAPEEFRELIQDYFSEIARQGTQP